MKIVFVTGNALKAKIAKDILSTYGVEVIQQKMDTPEIQAKSGQEVAEYSAEWASKSLNMPVVKSDVSYRVPSLNNFPGPFVKFVNLWLSAEDILKLLNGKKDRSLIIEEYLSFAEPNRKVKTFKTESICQIAEKIFDSSKGSSFDKIIIRPGYKVPQNVMSQQELDTMFFKEVTIWHFLGSYLQKLPNSRSN